MILGSGSVSRAAILRKAGYRFDVLSADIDEKAIRHPDPVALVSKLAQAKAEALIPKITGKAVLITADQVVSCRGEIWEKPESKEQARYFLQSYRDFPPQTIGSILVTDIVTGRQELAVDRATVVFQNLTDDVIEQIIAQPENYQYAGGFDIDGAGVFANVVQSMSHSDDVVKGLSLQSLKQLLNGLNINDSLFLEDIAE